LPEFLSEIKARGFAVKLDTNGTNPEMIFGLINDGLVDYVAMDIKNSPEKYPLTTGIQDLDVTPIRESADLLMRGQLPYEFRTTVVQEFHTAEDFCRIGEWIRGARAYYLQSFIDSGDLIGSDLHPHTKETLTHFLRIVQPYVENVHLRGI
jgi:pyruvate formate lyase activating enzyme